METITLNRTGDRPLRFEGEKLSKESTRMMSGNEANRWHVLTIYRVAGEDERLVVSVSYRTQWQGELDHEAVFGPSAIEGIADDLRVEYDPCAHMKGFPPGKQFEERQAFLERDIRSRYEAAVSRILEGFPERL